jgi:putative resolvase
LPSSIEIVGAGRTPSSESALAASNRRVVVIYDTEIVDDRVRYMGVVITSFCAGLYGRRSGQNRARAALAHAQETTS